LSNCVRVRCRADLAISDVFAEELPKSYQSVLFRQYCGNTFCAWLGDRTTGTRLDTSADDYAVQRGAAFHLTVFVDVERASRSVVTRRHVPSFIEVAYMKK